MGQAWASAGALALLCALALVAQASPAALDTYVVAIPPSVDPIGTRGGYATLVVVADTAGTLTLVNADITAHDVVADDPGPGTNAWCTRFAGHGYCPLFASRIVGIAGETPVEGTQALEPGSTYGFHCSIHHWMQGTLVAI